MKILVTGGLGYIGSHMVVELIKNEYDVIIIDNLSNSEIFILDNIKKITGVLPVFYNLDLLDTHKLEEVFNSHKIDGIIHFAAFKSVSESVKNPFRYYKNNLNSLMNVLNFMNDKNIENIRTHHIAQRYTWRLFQDRLNRDQKLGRRGSEGHNCQTNDQGWYAKPQAEVDRTLDQRIPGKQQDQKAEASQNPSAHPRPPRPQEQGPFPIL